MGNNAPSLLLRYIGVLGPRNSCQGQKDFMALIGSRSLQLGQALGTVSTLVSKEGQFSVVDRGGVYTW